MTQTQPAPTPKPILLISAGHTLQSLWKPLSERFTLLFVGDQRNFGLAKDLGADCLYIGQYATPDANENAINLAYRIASDLIRDEGLPMRILDAVGESEPPPQLRPFEVRSWWPAMVGEQLRQRIMLIEILKIVLLNHKVVGCVVHEDVTPDMRVMVEFCKSRNIPTIHVPHANCFYRGETWDIHTESICDYIAASGEYMKRFYSKWGFDQNKITATGTPSLDTWYADTPPTRKEARKVLGVGEDESVIIYASSWSQLTSTRSGFEAEHQRDFGLMLDAAKKLKATLCIKMHPGEAPDTEKFYIENLKGNGVRGFVTRAYNEYVLRAGDVMVAQGPSNVCIQAAIAGLPVAYIPTEGFGFERGPVEVGDNVLNAIETARGLTEQYWRDWLDDVNANPSKGAEKTAEFIVEKCNVRNQD